MRFRTQIDAWLIAVLGLALMLPLGVAVFAWRSEGIASPVAWLAMGIAALTVICVSIVAVPTYYELQPDRLLIRSGVLRWDVRLSAISAILPSSNVASGPAWSLDRLEVQSVRKGKAHSILISPQRPADFLHEIAIRDAGLIPDGEGLRRGR